MFIDWKNVNRVLVVRLRSIGDTVLATPALIALKRFLPAAQIDVLLEDWVAPVLENFQTVDNVLTFQKNNLKSRLKMARQVRRNRYDVVFNLHGGTTGTFFVCASSARHRVGFENYQYKFFYNHRLRSASDFWQKEFTHSAEQQLALLGFVGVPVEDKPKSQLVVSEKNAEKMDLLLQVHGIEDEKIALIHPAAAFEAKQWSTENFAKVIDYLAARSIFSVAVTAPAEKHIIEKLSKETSIAFHGFIDLTLPEITALAARAEIFIGNDSGIAHIAAAVNTPTVVVFGASNINHWRPWTGAPHEVVYAKKTCNHQLSGIRKGSENPKCIFCVEPQDVFIAVERILPHNLVVS